MGFSLTITQYLQTGLGYTALLAGLTILPWSLATGVGAGVGAAVLLPRIGRQVIQLGLLVMAAGIAITVITILMAPSPVSAWALIPGTAIGGLGMGLLVAPLTEMTLSRIPIELASDASGIFNSVGQLSAALGFATIGAAYFAALNVNPNQFHLALTAGLTTAIAVLLLALVASTRLPRNQATKTTGV